MNYTVQSHFFSLSELHTENSCRHSTCRDQQQDSIIAWTSWGREGISCWGAALEPQALVLSQPLASLTANPGLVPTTPSSLQEIGRSAYRKDQGDSDMGQGAELHPTGKDFQEKERVLFFWHLLTLSADRSLAKTSKQVGCPSSPSVPFFCRIILTQTIICNSSFHWKIHSDGCGWLLCFPAFSEWEWGCFLLIIQRENSPNQGENAILTPFHDSLGSGRILGFSTSGLLL